MKTSLDHLPAGHQENLEIIKEIIVSSLNPEMIILFGSYARGDYVERDYTVEDGITYEYNSDYDILIVGEERIRKNPIAMVKKRIAKQYFLTPTTIIEHNIGYLNEEISQNNYFFIDVLKEGILLYDTGNYQLATPQKVKPIGKLAKAKEYFEYWIGEGDDFYKGYEFYLEKELYKKAAFLLHQTVENTYNAFLLVATDYKPKTHNLEELRRQAIQVHRDHIEVFAIKSQEDQDRWILLIEAYIGARYKKDYTITAEQLRHLGEQAQLLIKLVKRLSKEIMDRMKRDIELVSNGDKA